MDGFGGGEGGRCNFRSGVANLFPFGWLIILNGVACDCRLPGVQYAVVANAEEEEEGGTLPFGGEYGLPLYG